METKLREYIAYSIAEMQVVTDERHNAEYAQGYIQALKDLGQEFFPDDRKLWE